MPPIFIGPSILNSDLANLTNEAMKLLDGGADFLHLDVMDGHFVPNITFGHPVVKCLRKNIPDVFFDAHMMVADPVKWIEPMQDAGANQYTFHMEAATDVPEVCRKIREAGMQVGLALKPETWLTVNSELTAIMDLCDLVLVMTVEPGFGGQSFMDDMLMKVEFMRTNYPKLKVGVDGGVNLQNIKCCAESGANMIVCGTAITGSKDPKSVITNMKDIVREYENKEFVILDRQSDFDTTL